MTHAVYVAAGWSIPLVVLGLYAMRVLRRGRRLSEQVPAEQRRWTAR